MHIQNPKELCLIDHVPALAAAGFGSLRIEAKTRDAKYVAATVAAYRQALDNPDADLAELRGEIQQLSPQGITKGHFFRGVE
jgi:putative protease